VSDISTFDGVKLGVPLAAPLVNASLEVAAKAQAALGGSGSGDLMQVVAPASRLALIAAIAACNAMLAMASAKCTRMSPPSDIDTVTGPDGDLILRCGHSPPHEWDYGTGTKRS
jgi:hypothetical protein